MKDIEILNKIIEKACKQGYTLTQASFDYVANFERLKSEKEDSVFSYYMKNMKYYDIIFSQDFSKAFWGEKDYWQETKCTCGGAIHPLLDQHFVECMKSKAKRGYKFHLQQIVLKEEPLKYFGEFLND